MEFRYQLPEGVVAVQVEPAESGFAVTILRPGSPATHYRVGAQRPEHGRLTICLQERRLRVHTARVGTARHVALGGQSWILAPPKPVGRRTHAEGGGSLEATMPGKVLDVLVSAGQEVAAGATLLLLEAMKMELSITAPAAGVVKQVFVQAGEVVEQGQRLVEIV